VKVPEVKRGWNEWAGEGANESGHDKRLARAQEAKRRKVEELKKARADSRLKGVVLN